MQVKQGTHILCLFRSCDEMSAHHDAFGLLFSRLLHEAGQLTEVPLVLLQEAWRRVTGHAQRHRYINSPCSVWHWGIVCGYRRGPHLSFGPGRDVRGCGELTGCADWDHWDTCSRLDDSGLAAIEFLDEFWAWRKQREEEVRRGNWLNRVWQIQPLNDTKV